MQKFGKVWMGYIPPRWYRPVTHPSRVLTGLNVEQLRSCDERHYHYAKLRKIREYVNIGYEFSQKVKLKNVKHVFYFRGVATFCALEGTRNDVGRH